MRWWSGWVVASWNGMEPTSCPLPPWMPPAGRTWRFSATPRLWRRDRGMLRIAIGTRSGSAANLRRTGKATVLLFDAGLVHYIKGAARERRPSMQCSPWNAMFEVSVTAVLADAADPNREGESFVRGGLTFHCDPSWAAGRSAVLAELLSDSTDDTHAPSPDRRHHRRQRHDLRHPPARAPPRARCREPPDPEPLGCADAAPRDELHGGAGAAARDEMYAQGDQGAAVSSGSFVTLGMIVLPCSMRTLGTIAHGMGETLIPRAADVVLKERRRLVLGVREAPLHEIHLENMLKLTRMGVIIAPPLPAFYNKPRTVDDIVDHTVTRMLDLFGMHTSGPGAGTGRWTPGKARCRTLPVIDKFTGEPIGELPVAAPRRWTAPSVTRGAFPAWSATPAHRDRRCCVAPRKLIDERKRDRWRHDCARGGQGVEACGRRSRAQRRDVHLLRRRGQAHPRRDGPDGRLGVRREPHRLLSARAAGRGRGDHAVQLSPEPGGAQGRPGAGRRQHGRAQAGGGDAAHRRRMADILADAGLPDGVLRLVHGEGPTTARRLCAIRCRPRSRSRAVRRSGG